MKKIITVLFFHFSLFTIHANAQQGEWTWMKGSNTNSSPATYGVIGVPSAANTPQGLYEPCEWRDKQGNFWMYGGYLNGSNYSTLWSYNPVTNEWMWVKGPSATANQSPVYGTQGVSNINNTPGARARCIATWVDTTGNLWLFGGDNSLGLAFGNLWKYEIATNEWTWVKGPNVTDVSGVYGIQGIPSAGNYPGSRRETNASWCDAENNLWLFGGYGKDINSTVGIENDLWRYNIATNEWTWMRGSKTNSNMGNYGSIGIPDTANNPPARMIYSKWKDEQGNFWIFGGGDFNTNLYYNDVWKYDPSINEWAWMSGSNAANDNGNTGTLCQTGIELIGPSRFENRACWIDHCGSFWTFAGSIGSNIDENYNDLWNFNSQTLEWTQAEGSVIVNQNGSYGTLGVSAESNQPPSRGGSVSWVDLDGNLWMWGGVNTSFAYYNDLWRYVIDPDCSSGGICNFTSIDFIATDTTLCEKFCINFFDSSGNNPVAWQWTFEGGIPSTSSSQNPSNICYQDPGEYDVTLITTDSNGKMDTLTLDNYITVFSNPFAPIITQDVNTLTCSPSTTYQWQFNGVDIPGATNQTYDMLQSGLYTVIIADENGCLSQSSYKAILSGVEELNTANYFSVYPNPSSGDFTVELLNGQIDKWLEIEIVNAIGQKLFYWEGIFPSSNQKEIQLPNVSSGVYFVEIKTANEFVRKKIVIR